MKTLDILGKKWFDKVNGNTYFSCRIIIDYAMPTQETKLMHFQYGYGEAYYYNALELVGPIDKDVIIRRFCWNNCKKKEVLEWTAY